MHVQVNDETGVPANLNPGRVAAMPDKHERVAEEISRLWPAGWKSVAPEIAAILRREYGEDGS